MSAPQLGYLCLSENPSAEAGRALIRQFVLVREAERMGYDDIWLAEHHGDSQWPHGGMLALLGHLAAVTAKSRIGSLVMMPGLHDPLMLAEHVATLDLLSKGRFQLGVASGGAQAAALQARGLDRGAARDRLHAHLDQVMALLAGQPWQAPGGGDLGLVPPPGQPAVPVWLAADDEASIRKAAERGWGLVAAATHTRERVLRMVDRYMAASQGRAPELTLARFASTAADHGDAVGVAQAYLSGFAQRAQAQGWGQDAKLSNAADPARLLADTLVGTHEEVAAQFKALAHSHGATRIAIVPTTGQFDAHKHILAAFVDEIRPLLDED
ncbi:MAG: hypothetical protein RI907_21 [Pseudomonadota bacterium]|jgi:alkanesulfonate monooxygenase SsuD/methylene tetrahydromethanopterin reductase-like flavin-dependent oxidoreductase (luciferase family)